MSLAEAREKAREWNALVKKGIDPAIEEGRQRQAAIEAEKQRQASTFGAAFEEYLRRKASKLKSGPDIEREMRREFKDWMGLPLADISPSLVKAAIQAIVDRGAPTQPRTFARGTSRLFSIGSSILAISTLKFRHAQRSSPAVLIGPRNIGSRVLKDFEIGAYWRGS